MVYLEWVAEGKVLVMQRDAALPDPADLPSPICRTGALELPCRGRAAMIQAWFAAVS